MLLRTFALAAVLAAPAAAQETTDSPLYASWAKHKPGTAVVLKSTATTAVMGNESKTDSTITYTLKEVTDDKVVVEMTSVTTVAGNEIKGPPFPMTFPKKVAKAGPMIPADQMPKLAKPEEGTETLKVGGTEYKAKWYKSKATLNGTETESKTWSSDDVPGMTLKSESTSTGPFTSKTTIELVEVKKP